MKKIIAFLIIFLSVFMISCSKNEFRIIGENEVEENCTIRLEIKTNLDITEDIIWSSSDESVATVIEGVVYGISEGTVQISASFKDYTDTAQVIVKEGYKEIVLTGSSSITLNSSSKMLIDISTDYNIEEINYSSSNEEVISLSNLQIGDSGLEITLNALKVGSSIITIFYGKFYSNFEVEVTDNVSLEIIIHGENETVVGKLTKFTANCEVIWSSSNPDIVEIDESGEAIAVSVGEVVIKATDKNNPNNVKEYNLTVYGRTPRTISISGRNKVGINQTTLLEITTSPSDSDSRVVWSSRNEEVATVDANGVVTGISLGRTYIVAVSLTDDSIATTFAIEVIASSPTEISISCDEEIVAGELIGLTLDVKGENVTKEVVYSTSDKKVAIADKGLILGLTEGVATIRATSIINDQVYGEITIKVNKYVAELVNEEANEYVNNILSQMTIEEKIGQMFIASYNGTTLTTDMSNAIDNNKIGNFIFMGYNVPSGSVAGSFASELQQKFVSSLKIPGFISIDQEGGRVSRLTNGGTRFLGNMALAASNDSQNAYLVGAAVGEELSNYGINFDLAPVLDVNNNPNNPIINNRSYSDNPITVSYFSSQMIKGLMSENVMSCAKHFPGHGNTSVDSHYGLPEITSSKEDLYSIELAPFINAIYNGIDAIMTTHIVFSAIDDELPATLSYDVLTNLLRDELGYEGLIVTDGMEMQAITNTFGIAEAAVLAVKAGADMLAYTTLANPITASNAILNAVNNNEISVERIDESVRRILLKKVKYNLFEDYLPKENYQNYDTSKNAALNLEVAKQSVTVHLGSLNGLDKEKSTIVFSTTSSFTLENNLSGTNNSFGYILSNYLKENGMAICDYENINTISSVASLVSKALEYEQIVIAVNDVKDIQALLVNQIALQREDLIVVALNLPYDINKYNNVNNYICIYEYTPIMVDALKRFMNKEYQATGVSPIDVK